MDQYLTLTSKISDLNNNLVQSKADVEHLAPATDLGYDVKLDPCIGFQGSKCFQKLERNHRNSGL